MRRNHTRRGCSQWERTAFLGLALVLVSTAPALAACTPPPYRVASDFRLVNTGTAVGNISIPRAELSIDNLLCLASALNDAHPEWIAASILIFDSEEAAEHVSLDDQVLGYRGYLRAALLKSRDQLTLTVTPFGLAAPFVSETIIDLPAAVPVRCRLALAGRCALVVPPIEYPERAWRTHTAGRVSVAARVAADGTVTDVQVVDTPRRRTNAFDQLVQSARSHLKGWRVDPAAHEDLVRFAYEYVLDPTGPATLGTIRSATDETLTIWRRPLEQRTR